jgi:hypothetical protein
MRLTSDSCSRARQEMTVVLAAPGMPLHHAPVLTAKQASSLMAAICEPLLSLPVGRLTRKLSAPTKLQPTGDRGMLSLWLLPDDSLSLVWQSAQQLPAATLEECAAGTRSGSSSSSSASGGGGSRGSGGSQALGLQQSCSVAMWEELAHFPAMSHLLDDAAGVLCLHALPQQQACRLPASAMPAPLTVCMCTAARSCPPTAASLARCSGHHPHAARRRLRPLLLHPCSR